MTEIAMSGTAIPTRGGEPMQRFHVCAALALKDQYLWMKVFNNANDSSAAALEQAGCDAILETFDEDAVRFTRLFFEHMLKDDRQFCGKDYTNIVDLEDGDFEKQAMTHCVYHALRDMYKDQVEQYLMYLRDEASQSSVEHMLAMGTKSVTDMLLSHMYICPVVDEISQNDFDLIRAHFYNERRKAA